MAVIRLDKLLSSMGYGSRRDAKSILKKGLVKVDGTVVKRPETKVDTDKNTVTVAGEKIEYYEFIYLMMNKPAGVISATEDPYEEDKTVIDLLEEKYQWFDLFPVGRLDKDTEGLLLLTNNGTFAHKTLSPKKHVSKIYYAKIDGALTENDVTAFQNGIRTDEKTIYKPAILTIQKSDAVSEALIEISEGKFHQVKRMFEAVGKSVLYLKRISFAGIELDGTLDLGEYRELNGDEMLRLDRYM